MRPRLWSVSDAFSLPDVLVRRIPLRVARREPLATPRPGGEADPVLRVEAPVHHEARGGVDSPFGGRDVPPERLPAPDRFPCPFAVEEGAEEGRRDGVGPSPERLLQDAPRRIQNPLVVKGELRDVRLLGPVVVRGRAPLVRALDQFIYSADGTLQRRVEESRELLHRILHAVLPLFDAVREHDVEVRPDLVASHLH